jgi:hypothetical protein
VACRWLLTDLKSETGPDTKCIRFLFLLKTFEFFFGISKLVVFILYTLLSFMGGGHRATRRKVAGSIPDGVIGIFYSHNPSGRTMALGPTQPLTEMSTRNIS